QAELIIAIGESLQRRFQVSVCVRLQSIMMIGRSLDFFHELGGQYGSVGLGQQTIKIGQMLGRLITEADHDAAAATEMVFQPPLLAGTELGNVAKEKAVIGG